MGLFKRIKQRKQSQKANTNHNVPYMLEMLEPRLLLSADLTTMGVAGVLSSGLGRFDSQLDDFIDVDYTTEFDTRLPLVVRNEGTDILDYHSVAPKIREVLAVDVDINRDGYIGVDPPGVTLPTTLLAAENALDLLDVVGSDHKVDFLEFIQGSFLDEISPYLDGTKTNAEFVTALEGLDKTAGLQNGLPYQVDSIDFYAPARWINLEVSSASDTSNDNQVSFELDFSLTFRNELALDLGTVAEDLGITFPDTNLEVNATLDFTVEVGVFTSGETPPDLNNDDFFLDFIQTSGDDLTLTVDGSTSVTDDVNVGFLGTQVSAGSVTLTANLSGNMTDPTTPTTLGFSASQFGQTALNGTITAQNIPSAYDLTDDAVFILRIGSSDARTVTVGDVLTDGNGTITALVTDVNTAVGNAGLGSVITVDSTVVPVTDRLILSVVSFDATKFGFSSNDLSGTTLTGSSVTSPSGDMSFLISVDHDIPVLISVSGVASLADLKTKLNTALSSSGTGVTATWIGTSSDELQLTAGGSHLEISDNLTFDSKLSYSDLGESITSLMGTTLDTSGSTFGVNLPIVVKSGLVTLPGTPAISFSTPTSDPFLLTAPTADADGNIRFDFGVDITGVTPAEKQDVLNFTNISASDVTGLLRRLGNWLDKARQTDSFASIEIPFSDTDLSDLLDFENMVADEWFDATALNALITANNDPNFSTAQELAAKLGAASYNAGTDELTYSVNLTHTLDPLTVPIDFNLDLTPLLDISSNSEVQLTANGTLMAKLGFFLGPMAGSTLTNETTLDSLGIDMEKIEAGPAVTAENTPRIIYGRLNNDATFDIEFGSNTYRVIVYASDPDEEGLLPLTDDNLTVGHLISDIDYALAHAVQIPGNTPVNLKTAHGFSVALDPDNNMRIKLSSSTTDFTLKAAQGDPAVNQLGFKTTHEAEGSATPYSVTTIKDAPRLVGRLTSDTTFEIIIGGTHYPITIEAGETVIVKDGKEFDGNRTIIDLINDLNKAIETPSLVSSAVSVNQLSTDAIFNIIINGGTTVPITVLANSTDGTAFFAFNFDGSTTIDTVEDTISFGSAHKFITGDKVVYTDGGGTTIGGLTDGATYYVIVEDSTTVKLAETEDDANSNLAIALLAVGVGLDHRLTHTANDDFEDLIDDINRAFIGTSLDGLIRAEDYERPTDTHHIRLKAMDDSVVKFELAVTASTPAADDLKLPAGTHLYANLSDTIEILSQGDHLVLRAYSDELTFDGVTDVTIGDDTITINNHGLVTGRTVTYSSSGTPIGNLSEGGTYNVIVVDGDTVKLATSESNAFAGTQIDLIAGASSGDHKLTAASVSAFDVDGSSASELGFGASQTANDDDLIIRLSNNTSPTVTLDGTTILDIIDDIHQATGGTLVAGHYIGDGDVLVEIDPDEGTGLRLKDNTFSGTATDPIFRVEPTNASPAAIRLGILAMDPGGDLNDDGFVNAVDGDSYIDGGPLTGADLADRFFIENAQLSASFTLDTPSLTFSSLATHASEHDKVVHIDFDPIHIGMYIDITGTGFTAGRYKIVDVQGNEAELDDDAWTSSSTSGTGTILGIQASASFGFVGIDLIGSGSLTGSISAGLNGGSRVYLSELVADLGAAADFVDQPTSFSGSGSFVLDVIVSPDFLSLLSTGTPQITINVNSIGDAFTITEFSDISTPAPTWVDADTFSLTGDYTSTFKKGLVVDIGLGSLVVPAEILGSTYASGTNLTTVDLVSGVLSGGSIDKVFAPTPPDISLTFADLDDLVDFDDIGFSNILDAISDLVDFLSGIEGLEFFDLEIPLIGKSVNDLLSLADKFTTALDEITSDPAGSIQLVETKLKNALGLPISSPSILSLDPLDSNILKFELDLVASFNESLGVELPEFLDLGDLGLGLSGSIGLGGSADLNANGSLTANLDFGIDLGVSDPLNLGDIYIYDTTGVDAEINASGENLSFWASLGPFGLFIQNHPDYDSEISINGTFSAGVKDSAQGGNKALISSVLFDLDNFDTTITGTVGGTLPTFFPMESTYVGNITITDESLASPGNLADISRFEFLTEASEVTALLADPDYLNPGENSIVLNAADVIQGIKDFDFSNQFNLFDNILLAVDGIDMFLEGIQYLLDTEIFSGLSLPVIGNPFTEGADFIEDFREDFVQPLRELIEAVENAAKDFADADKNIISGFLYDILGGLLQETDNVPQSGDPDFGDFQGYYGDEENKLIGLTTNLDRYLDDGSVDLKDTYIQWNLTVGDEYNFGTDFGFDVGVPGLGLEADGDVSVKIAWDLDFGFGISFQDGFYLDISDQNELTAYLIVELGDTTLVGTLGFLQLTAAVNEVDLGLAFEVDIKEDGAIGDDADKLTFTELGKIEIEFGIAAEAIIDLALELGISGDVVGSAASGFPKVGADFILDWGIGGFDSNDPELSAFVTITEIVPALQNSLKFVGFQNITLDVGSFVSDVLGPIVGKVQDITEPIQPLIDFITTPFPVLSDFGLNITPLDLAAMYGSFDPGLIYAIADIITLINKIPDPDEVGSLKIVIMDNLPIYDDGLSEYSTGTAFESLGGNLWNSDFDLSNAFDQITGNLESIFGDIFGDNWFSDALGTLAGEAADIMGDLTSESAKTNPWAFPILDDPMQVIGLFMGRPAVLVTYDMEPLVFEFEYSQFFPIWGPLGVSINVELGATIDFAFGYDTLGIQEFIESDFRNPLLLFDGFYVSDTDLATGDFGTDVPELVLNGGLWAAAEINLGVARAGVGGGVFIEIDFDLFDPDRDGRIRIKELLGNIYNEFVYGEWALAPLAIFDVHGEITAKLFAFLKIDLFLFEIDKRWDITPEILILEFDIPFTRPPILATELPGGDLQINAGPYADQRLNGNINDIAEEFVIEQDSAGGGVKVRAPGLWNDWQEYSMSSTGTVIFKGGEGDDKFDASGMDQDAIKFEIDGGVGNDTIKLGPASASGAAVIMGSEGDDTIYGGDGDDIIYGLKGNDTIYGGGGNDIIFGDDGRISSESITAFFNPSEDGNDTIYGGSGNDILFGSGGVDTINGDANNDIIIGDGGKLEFTGSEAKTVANVDEVKGTQRDRLDPQGGNDILTGGADTDIIYGGTGNDTIDGEDGTDELYGEDGFDTIDGGSEADEIYGGTGGDTIYGGAGDDIIYGQDGRDTIFGDANADNNPDPNPGNDTIYGGAGADTIDGDGGADTIFGEGDPDWIQGGSGNDILDGGAGNDVVFGDRGFDDISGTSPLFDGASGVNPGDDEILFSADHGFLSGQAFKYSAGGGAAIGGLVEGDTYYVIVTGDKTIKLADSKADAWNGIARDITADGSGASHVFVPVWNPKVYGNNTLSNYFYLFGVTTSANPDLIDPNPNGADDTIHSGDGSDFLDGQWGSDTYKIRPQGANNDGIMSVHDSGESSLHVDFMHVKGTLYDDTFLLRKSSSSTGLSFVALLNEEPYAERINYWSVEGGFGLERMLISGLFGDDHFASDDVGTDTTLEGNEGEDTFQVGQLYNSPRDICASEYNNIEPEDVFPTIETTVGWLSDGINLPMTVYGGIGNDYFTVFHNKAVLSLFGEDGDDTFLIKAFALAGSQEPFRDRTDISGGAGADLVQYAMNAPVNIDGGDGFDRVIIIGTEFGDDFVVTRDGVYGAGLNVNFVNIESLAVDGAEGDDRFYVLSTGEDFMTELFGGLGSDTFNMSGDTPPIISNDLRGHSGIITHDIENTDTNYDETIIAGISANVADNNTEDPVVVISEPDGSTVITEGGPYDSYYIVLSAAPSAAITVQVYAPVQTQDQQEREAKMFQLYSPSPHSATSDRTSISLEFTPGNWYTPQEVQVSAPNYTLLEKFFNPALIPLDYDDDAIEGDQTGFINHVVTTAIGITGTPDLIAVIPDVDDSTKYTTEFTDSSKVFTDSLTGYILRITDGPGAGQSLRILGVKKDDSDPPVPIPDTLILDGKFRECEGSVVGSASMYKISRDIEANRAITVLVHDDDKADVIVTPSDNSTDLFEDGNSDTIDVVLARQPEDSNVTVTLASNDGQLTFDLPTLTFSKTGSDPNAWDIPQTVTVSADDDSIREGFHHGLITFTSAGGDSDRLSSPTHQETITLTEEQAYVGLLNRPAKTGETYLVSEVLVDGSPRSAETYDVVSNKIIFLTEGGDYDELPVGTVVKVTYEYDIVGYDGFNVTPLLTDIADNEVPQVKITQTGGFTDVIETFWAAKLVHGLYGTPWEDSYDVVLTQQPTDNVEILVDPQITKTSVGKSIHWGEQVTADSSAPGAVDNGDGSVTLTFTAANWDTPQTVYVSAVDDGVYDGDDTQVFAPEPHTISGIQGPLYLYGEGGYGSIIAFEPTMLHYETNFMPETDTLTPPDEGVGGDGTTMTVDREPLFDGAQLLNDVINDLIVDGDITEQERQEIADALVDEMMTITLADGIIKMIGDDPVFLKEIGQFRLIVDAVYNSGSDTVTLTLNEAWDLTESWAEFNDDVDTYDMITEYRITEMSPNFFAIEEEKIDYVFVYNEDSQADNEVPSREGWLTDSTTVGYAGNSIVEGFVTNQDGKWLRGFGMAAQDLFLGGVYHPRGITYGDMEVVEINLGDGIDEFTVEDTHVRADGYQTWTIINTGDEVEENAGDLVILDLDSDAADLHVGTVTGESAYTLEDTSAVFPVTTGEKGLVGYLVEITGGTGLGQQRVIESNTANELTVEKDWDVVLDTTSEYRVIGAGLYTGTATSAESDDSVTIEDTSQTFPALAGHIIEIIDGAGVGTRREIISNTATVLTVSSAWNSELDTTTVYRIYGEQDGPISVNAQRGDDIVDGSESTIPLVIFGGDGQDELTGGSGDDIIFGDRGRVEYVNEDGKIVTLLGLAREKLDPQYLNAFTANTLTDDDGNFPVQTIDMQGLEGFMLSIPDGRGFGQRAQITANTSDMLTVTPEWEEDLLPVWPTYNPDVDFDPVDPQSNPSKYRISLIPEDQTDGVKRDPVLIIAIDPSVGDDDVIIGNMGNDRIFGGAADDTINGNDGDDTIFGDHGRLDYTPADVGGEDGPVRGDFVPATLDRIRTTYDDIGGADTIYGDDGEDIILGGYNPNEQDSEDNLYGNAGNDIIIGDNGLLDFSPNAATVDEPRDVVLYSIETIAPDDGGDDIIYGNTENDIIFGGDESDVIDAGEGNNIVLGDNGLIDYVRAESDPGVPGADWNPGDIDLIESNATTFAGGIDNITSGDGQDIIIGGRFGDTVNANDGDNLVIGDSGRITAADEDAPQFTGQPITFGLIETIEPNDGGNDTINTLTGYDIVLGGNANDTIDVGQGNNIVLGDNGLIDYVRAEREPTADGADVNSGDIDLIVSTATTFAGGVDDITSGDGQDIIIGGRFGDTVNANDGDNIVIGDSGRITAADEDAPQFTGQPMTFGLIETMTPDDGGNDTINTLTGYDIVFGGDEDDTIDVGEGNNIVLGDNGLIDYVRAEREPTADGADVNSGDIDLIVSTATTFAGGSDIITSGDGQDIIIGGRFGDTVNANDGDNLIIGDSGQIEATDSNIIHQFAGHPMTVGLIETIQPDDGGQDTVTTGDDNDIVIGGFESDTIVAGGDDDYVLGDNGKFLYDLLTDYISDLGRPDITAHLAGDTLTLDGGLQPDPDPRTLDIVTTTNPTLGDDDVIYGSDGNDVIFGGTGRDRIWGDNDNDNFNDNDGDGADIIFGDHAKIYPSIDDAVIDEDFLPAQFNNPDHDAFFINNNFFSIDTGEADGFNTDGVMEYAPGTDFEDTIFGSGGDDTIIGGQDDDIMFGGEDDDILIGGHNVLGGHDEIDDMDQALQDAILSGVLANLDASDINDINDIMDGGGDEDLMAGDNTIVIRQNDFTTSFLLNSQSLRYQQLDGTVIYSMVSQTLGGLYDMNVGFFSNIEGTPQAEPGTDVGYTVIMLDHSEGIATDAAQSPTDPRFFGNDVMAGGSENDEMFGQLGDDIMQGDGSVDMVSDTTGWQMPDGTTPFDPSPAVDPSFIIPDNQSTPTYFMVEGNYLLFHSDEAANDGDDYMEGNAGNDRMYGNLGQDDMIGGNSTLFGLSDEDAVFYGLEPDDFARPDGADLIYGGAGNPTRLARNDFVGDGINDTTAPSSNDPQVPLENRHARDADVILGDNANIYRLIDGSDNYLEFNYDQTFTYENRGDLRIIPRAVEFLDYAYSFGFDGTEVSATFAGVGYGDLIYGESGDDIIHGMTGDDALFGNSDDDDLYGEVGNDWVSGGTGEDGILGDDGLILTSRNDTNDEPLYGIEALDATGKDAEINREIKTPGNIQRAIINVEDALKKTVDLISFNLEGDGIPVNDIIYGGLNDDWIHAGAGDDAMSGAEALPAYYSGEGFGFNTINTLLQDQQDAPINTDPPLAPNPFWFDFAPYNPGDILRYEGNTAADPDDPHGKTKQEFALYDEFFPRRKIMLDADGKAVETSTEAVFDFLLNFNEDEGPFGYHYLGDENAMMTDGDDRIFGDLGNDWMVGGTGRDNMYGGRGDDLLNMDDNHDSGPGGKVKPHDPPTDPLDNTQSDEYQAYADIAYGGAGRDVLILNTGADRAIDWVGEYNSYIVPFSPFGAFHISRTLQPQLPEFLYDLSESDGIDTTVPDGARYVEQKTLDVRVDVPDPLRNGEPYGELGMVRQTDFDWHDQTGAPNDPQPGNLQGQRDIMRRELFTDTDPVKLAFGVDVGTWTLADGGYEAAPETLFGEAVSIYHLDLMQPSYMEILATVKISKALELAGLKKKDAEELSSANAYIIFDYLSATDFKFAGLSQKRNKVQIGHRTPDGWVTDVELSMQLRANRDYDLTLVMYGTLATIWVNEQVSLSHDFGEPLNDGLIGLGTDNSVARFDDFQVQKLPPTITFQFPVDFQETSPNPFVQNQGVWVTEDGRYVGSASEGQPALATWDLSVAVWSLLEFEALIDTESTGGLVFDYYGSEDFKFAAIDTLNDQVVIGHYTSKGWFIDASAERAIEPGIYYELGISMLGTTVSVTLDGEAVVGHVFNSLLNDGDLGLLSKDGVSSFDYVVAQGDDPAYAEESGEALKATSLGDATDITELNQAELAPIIDAAIDYWVDIAGVDASKLADVSFLITDLSEMFLAVTVGNTILIDTDAAGYGWFVDETPYDNIEFGSDGGNGELAAALNSEAEGSMDLLTVVTHELGHVLGLENVDTEEQDLMSDTLATGVRRVYAEDAITTLPLDAWIVHHYSFNNLLNDDGDLGAIN